DLDARSVDLLEDRVTHRRLAHTRRPAEPKERNTSTRHRRQRSRDRRGPFPARAPSLVPIAWPPTGDETVTRLLARLSASAAVTPMTIRAPPESMKPVLTPTLSMIAVAMTGAIAMAPPMPASHRPRALARW